MDKNTEYFHERQRACMEADLKETVGELRRLLDVNGQRHPDAQVPTLTECVADEDRFIAVNGSAHRMYEPFVKFFRKRPEFRQVVQRALDDTYNV